MNSADDAPAVAASDIIAAAHAEQNAAAAAAGEGLEDFAANIDGDFDDFRASLGALGVLQGNQDE